MEVRKRTYPNVNCRQYSHAHFHFVQAQVPTLPLASKHAHLLCVEVWHEGKHVSLTQYPLPPRVISSLVPHLVVVAAVCIEHLGHITWGGAYSQHVRAM